MYKMTTKSFINRVLLILLSIVSGSVSASAYTQITDSSFDTKWVQFSNYSKVAVFSSKQDITGSNPNNYLQLYKFDLLNNNIQQITALDRNVINFKISGNGQAVAYQHNGNEFNQNSDGEYQIFYRDLNTNNGYQLSQITSADDPLDVNFRRIYHINFSGNLIFHEVATGSLNRTEYYSITNNSFTTTVPGVIFITDIVISDDGSSIYINDRKGLKRIDSSNGAITDIFIGPSSSDFGTFGFDLSNNDTSLYFSADVNPLGTNPNLNYEIFKVDIDGNNLIQMTESLNYHSYRPNIFKNNSLVYFDSNENFIGENPTNEKRIYSLDNNLNIDQIPNIINPVTYKISGDGSKIIYWIFTGDTPSFGSNGIHSLYIMNIDGSDLQKLTDSYTDSSPYPFLDVPPSYISDDGTFVLFSSTENILGSNSDQSYEIFLWSANATSNTDNNFPDNSSSSGGVLGINELIIFLLASLTRTIKTRMLTRTSARP